MIVKAHCIRCPQVLLLHWNKEHRDMLLQLHCSDCGSKLGLRVGVANRTSASLFNFATKVGI